MVIKFERADAVEDIMTEARNPRIGLMARHECAMSRAGSASTRAENAEFGFSHFVSQARRKPRLTVYFDRKKDNTFL